MVGFFGLFGRGNKDKEYKIKDIYSNLRDQILKLDPNAINIQQDQAHPKVWGILMETGHPDAVVTLAAIGDGTGSIYFSNGGALIGLGQHEQLRIAADKFIKESQNYIELFTTTEQYPLPKNGYTRFYLLTFSGVLTAEVKEEVLGNTQHKFSQLFFKGQEVITQARLLDEAN